MILLIIVLCISNIISSLYYFHMIRGMLQFVCTLHHKLYNILNITMCHMTSHNTMCHMTSHITMCCMTSHITLSYDITHHHVRYDITHQTVPDDITHHTVLYDITHHCAVWHHTSLCCMTSHITLSKVMYLVLVATCRGQFHEFMYSTCRLNKLFYIKCDISGPLLAVILEDLKTISLHWFMQCHL